MSIIEGDAIGPYQIQEQLGHGGMATVYKAYHPVLDRYVAIKFMDVALSKEPGFLQRFRREARVIANLDNTHIVPVYDFNEYKGQPYIVLKFIDGPTLKGRMQASPLSKEETLKIINAVGNGLQYAHHHGILHRDIKPSNVLISSEGEVYITDFGLARIMEGTSSLTGDMIVGTPHYISPEQAMNTEEIDEGTDIYSFGVMIYEMVVGCLPFDGDTTFSIIEDHIFEPPPPPRSINSDLSPEIEQIILKALEKKRDDRQKHVADLVGSFKMAWLSDTDQSNISSTTMEATEIATLQAKNGKAFPVVEELTVLGRNSSSKKIQNDIDLSNLDEKKIVSRRHAKIQRADNEFILYDLESRNGTYVNGKRMSPKQPHTLTSGDVLEFGSGGVKLTFIR